MSRHPLVSVVMPFLDPPVPFFREAVESVLRQTLEDWELLLVNDGSGDEATAVACEYAEAQPDRIRVLAHDGQRNLGAAPSRNLALARARGEVAALLDSDDVWSPERLEVHVRLLDEHPQAGMVCGPSLYWWSWNGESSPDARPVDFAPSLGVPRERLLAPPSILPVFLTGDGAVPCPTAVTVRRAMALEIGGFEEDFTGPYAVYEDQAFLAKMALHHPTVTTDEVLDRYRQDSRSITATTDADQTREARKAFLEWLREYTRRRSAQDRNLHRIIAVELWALEHPLGGRTLRALRRMRRRLAPGRPGSVSDGAVTLRGGDR